MARANFIRNGLQWARSPSRNLGWSADDVSRMFPSEESEEDKKRKRADSTIDSFRFISPLDGFETSTIPSGKGEGGDLHVVAPNCQLKLPPPSFISVKELNSQLPAIHATPGPSIFGQVGGGATPMDTMEQNVVVKQEQTLFGYTPQNGMTEVAVGNGRECRSSSNDELNFPTGGRRGRKNFRERQRRQTMKEKFEELTRLVCVESDAEKDRSMEMASQRAKVKMKKMDVLSKAIVTIKDLQDQVQALQGQRYRMESLLRQANVPATMASSANQRQLMPNRTIMPVSYTPSQRGVLHLEH